MRIRQLTLENISIPFPLKPFKECCNCTLTVSLMYGRHGNGFYGKPMIDGWVPNKLICL